MERAEAMTRVAEVDHRENEDRAVRLSELDALLTDDVVGSSGQAAEWLFEDVKATLIHGYFTATILAAYAFCAQQLAGVMRMLPDDPDLPEQTISLEALAAATRDRGLIDVDLHARLVTLHDSATMYLTVGLHEHEAPVERRVAEAALLTDEHPLLGDARNALECSVAVLHRR